MCQVDHLYTAHDKIMNWKGRVFILNLGPSCAGYDVLLPQLND